MEGFENLRREQKAYMLKEHGVLIDSIKTYQANVLLYSMQRLFIEVYCDPDTNAIMRISAASEQDLDKYLHRIHIVL